MSTSQLVDAVGLSSQGLFEVLNSRRRRLAIVELSRLNRSIDVSELAREIAKRHEIADGDTAPHKRIHVGLLQQHLPAMKKAGLVEVSQTNTITPHPDIRTVADVIEAVGMICAAPEVPK